MTTRHSSEAGTGRSGASTSETGAAGAEVFLATIALNSLRSSSRWNCHSPSSHAAHASRATMIANSTQRRVNRNRSDRTLARLAGDRQRFGFGPFGLEQLGP